MNTNHDTRHSNEITLNVVAVTAPGSIIRLGSRWTFVLILRCTCTALLRACMSMCDPCDDVPCDTLGEPPTSWLRETSSTSNTARAGDSKCRQHQQKTTAESLKQLRCWMMMILTALVA